MFKIMEVRGDYVKITEISEISDSVVDMALRKFKDKQKSGFYLCDFSDVIWRYTNEIQPYQLDFRYRHKEFKHVCERRGIDYKKYIYYLKVIFVLLQGTMPPKKLGMLIRYIIDELIKSEFGSRLETPKQTAHGDMLRQYINVIQLFEPVNADYTQMCQRVSNAITAINTETRKQYYNHRRSLAEITSYLQFDHYFSQAWAIMTEEEQAYYYPLKLFWDIVTILPTRPTEFCILATNCLEERDGHHYITMRKSDLKGRKLHLRTDTVEGDYIVRTYEISERIFLEIQDYLERSKEYERLGGMLISLDYLSAHEKKKGRKKTKRLFNTKDLRRLISDFYDEYMVTVFGFTIVTQDDLYVQFCLSDEDEADFKLGQDQTMKFKPHDLRHLAMINLMIHGASPALMQAFAGHRSNYMWEKYAYNVTKMIRCGAVYFYEKSNEQRAVDFDAQLPNPLILFSQHSTGIDMGSGNCYSESFANGDVIDCLSSGGDCTRCTYYVKHNQFKTIAQKAETNMLEERISTEVKMLRHILSSEGVEAKLEEYQTLMLNIQSDLHLYAEKCLKELTDGK